jgi:hypothetical protein
MHATLYTREPILCCRYLHYENKVNKARSYLIKTREIHRVYSDPRRRRGRCVVGYVQ